MFKIARPLEDEAPEWSPIITPKKPSGEATGYGGRGRRFKEHGTGTYY